MLKCRNVACGETSLSSTWNCRCNTKWIRCPRHVLEAKAPIKKMKKDESLKKRREAVYGVDRPQPQPRKALGPLEEGTDLNESEPPPPNQQPPQQWKGKGGGRSSAAAASSNQQPPHQWKGSDDAQAGTAASTNQQPPHLWKGTVDAEAEAGNTSLHQQPPHSWKGGSDEAKTDAVSRVSGMTDYARRKAAMVRKAALSPTASHNRFNESFNRSNAPDAIKIKFAKLRGLALHTSEPNPNLPAPSNSDGAG